MKGYKAFDKGLICRGKQYAENTVFEEESAEICKIGMHFCENPLDCLDYYPLVDDNGDMVEIAEVEALDVAKTDDKKKFCTKKMKVGAKLSLAKFIKASFVFLYKKADNGGEKSSGDFVKMASSGDSAQMASSGKFVKMASSGDSAQMASSGRCAKMASSGAYAKMVSLGRCAKMVSSGECVQMVSSGDSAVICCAGPGSIAKGKKGSWITLAEWAWSKEKKAHIPVCVKTEQIDGVRIKEETFYKLENGEFVEVEG